MNQASSISLVVQQGPLPGDSRTIKNQPLIVGRGSASEWVINEGTLSRKHAQFSPTPHGVTVEDLGSSNGTFVNEQLVNRPTILRPGDTVRLGHHVRLTVQPSQPVADDKPTIMAGGGMVGPPTPQNFKTTLSFQQPGASQPRNPWLWVVAATVVALFIIGGTVAYVSWQRPAQPVVGLSPSPTPDEAVASTPLPATDRPAPTPTDTPIPIDLPTVTPSVVTEQPLPTEEPTLTPTPLPATPTATNTTQTQISAAPLGIFQDFEQNSSWRRGDQPNGEFIRSATQTRSGNYAGQLNYDFPTTGNDFVVFLHSRALAGRPNGITAWVYGDGKSHYLNVWLKDAGSQVWQMSFGQVNHTGWRQMTAFIDPNQPWPAGHISGSDDGTIDYPLTFYALTMDDAPDSFRGQGTIYLDDLASTESASRPRPTATVRRPGTTGGDTVTGLYSLRLGNQHNYQEPWGGDKGDPCRAWRENDFDDKNPNFRGFNVELWLTNNTSRKVADNWGEGLDFISNTGQSLTACYYGYQGMGPPPKGRSSVTFFSVVPQGQFVQTIELRLSGQIIRLCLDGRGRAWSC